MSWLFGGFVVIPVVSLNTYNHMMGGGMEEEVIIGLDDVLCIQNYDIEFFCR